VVDAAMIPRALEKPVTNRARYLPADHRAHRLPHRERAHLRIVGGERAVLEPRVREQVQVDVLDRPAHDLHLRASQ